MFPVPGKSQTLPIVANGIASEIITKLSVLRKDTCLFLRIILSCSLNVAKVLKPQEGPTCGELLNKA